MPLEEPHLRLLARYTPPGWDDPIPECGDGHDWGAWRRHPNRVNLWRACRRQGCSFTDWDEAPPRRGLLARLRGRV